MIAAQLLAELDAVVVHGHGVRRDILLDIEGILRREGFDGKGAGALRRKIRLIRLCRLCRLCIRLVPGEGERVKCNRLALRRGLGRQYLAVFVGQLEGEITL